MREGNTSGPGTRRVAAGTDTPPRTIFQTTLPGNDRRCSTGLLQASSLQPTSPPKKRSIKKLVWTGPRMSGAQDARIAHNVKENTVGQTAIE